MEQKSCLKMIYKVPASGAGVESFQDLGYLIAEEGRFSNNEIEELYAHDLKRAVQLLNERSFDHYFMRLDDAKSFLECYEPDPEWI